MAESVAPGTMLHVTVTLKPRHPAALAEYARAVATPGSRVYHEYLTPAQFARRFGARPAEVRAVRSALQARGLTLGPVSAGSLSIPVRASAIALERGFSISLRRLAVPGRRTALAASAAPAFAAGAASAVQSVIGLDTTSAPRPLLVRTTVGAGSPAPLTGSGALARPHVATGGPQPCAAAQSAASDQSAHTADQIASAYGFSGLYGAGDRGEGTTVAVYELEAVDPSDLATYEACYGIHPSISYVEVDHGAGTGAGSGEAALDIENLIGLAPDANVIVYQGPNSNSSSPGSGPYDTLSAIVSQDRAQVVSISWGECEAALGAQNATAENALFEQAAVQGQTIVAAAGDSGSEDCDGSSSIPQTQLAVDDPASQPFVTGVGGTTFGSLGPRPTESVWNDGGGLPGGRLQPGATGGGISDLWPMPEAQRLASPALRVLAAGATGSQCGDPGGYCREVPDVSADADPATGYLIYWNGSGKAPAQQQGWQAIGGTSAAAPVWAALMSLTDASQACQQSPLGYVLPALYRAAGSSYASDFNDVRTGNNDFTGTNGGQFPAGPHYDVASGLGTPNGASLASSLCSNTLRLTPPGAQRSAAGSTVSLRLRDQDIPGAAARFSATGLPPGLTLASATGRVAGRPRRIGTYHVVVTATDAAGSSASETFTWSVGAAARILNPSLTGFTQRRPTLAFTVAAGRGAPALRDLAVGIPKELELLSARGVTVTTNGATRARFESRGAGGALVIKLRRALRRVRVTLAYPHLHVVSGRHAHALGRGASVLEVSVTDTALGSSPLYARLGRG